MTDRSNRSTSTRSSRPSARCAVGPATASTPCGSPPGPSPASSTAPPPRSSTSCPSAPRPRSSPRSPTTPGSPPACCRPSSTRRSRTRTSTPSASRSPLGHAQGIIGDETADMVATNARKLNDAIHTERNWLYEFFGLRTVYDRYLLRHPETRQVIETPQYFLLRVACGLSTSPEEAIEFYELISVARLPAVVADAVQLGHHPPADVELLPARLARGQPRRHLRPLPRRRPAVEARRRHRPLLQPHPQPRLAHPRHQRPVQRHRAVAQDARLVGGRGQPGRPSQGRGVRLPRDVARRHRGVPRARDNTGDTARRTHNLNLANWVPDLFMERVENDWQWSLFDPKKVPHLVDLYGDEFRTAYLEAESAGLYERQVPARSALQPHDAHAWPRPATAG